MGALPGEAGGPPAMFSYFHAAAAVVGVTSLNGPEGKCDCSTGPWSFEAGWELRSGPFPERRGPSPFEYSLENTGTLRTSGTSGTLASRLCCLGLCASPVLRKGVLSAGSSFVGFYSVTLLSKNYLLTRYHYLLLGDNYY